MDQTLLLPEVIRPDVWFQGALPWVDKSHTTLAYMAIAQQPATMNTDLVKLAEVKRWQDLIDPKWKGKIILDDPAVTGKGSSSFLSAMKIMGMDYIQALLRQELMITRDKRLHAEWVARGKYPIGLGVDDSIRVEFQRAGAP